MIWLAVTLAVVGLLAVLLVLAIFDVGWAQTVWACIILATACVVNGLRIRAIQLATLGVLVLIVCIATGL